MTKLAAAQLQEAMKLGVPLDEVLHLVQDTEVSGPTLAEIVHSPVVTCAVAHPAACRH